MPSLRAIISSIFALALVSAPGAQAGAWIKSNVTDADNTLLISAVSDVSTYSSGVSTYLCVYKVNSLKKQGTTGSSKYDFGVTGCNAGEEFVGRCPDLTSFPRCGDYNIVVSSDSKTGKAKVTSVTNVASKQKSKQESQQKDPKQESQQKDPKQESQQKDPKQESQRDPKQEQ